MRAYLNPTIRNYRSLLWLAFALPTALWAQEERRGDEVKSVEIRVVEDYQAQVRAAHKISEQPSFADTTSEKLDVEVRIQPKALTIDFSPQPITPIQLGRVRLPKLPTQQVSVGGGNYASSHASFILSSPRSKQNVWGIRATHDGALGGAQSNYERQPLYRNEVLADLQRATKNWNLKTQALARMNYISYYGMNTPLTVIYDSVPGAWQQTYGLSGQWLRTSNPTSKVPAMYRSGGLSYQFTHAGYATNEHLIKTVQRFEVYADENVVDVDFGYQLGQLSSWADSAATYHHFFLAPITRGKNGMLSYEFGLNFSGTQATGSDTTGFEYYVFPRVNLQAEVLRRTLAVYGGWDGRAHQHTLQSLLQEAPWLTLQQELRLSGENRGYVGMQGALVGKLQYRVEGSLAFINDALQFERDSTATLVNVNGAELAALQVGYAEQITRTSVRGELNLPLKDLTISTYAQFNAFAGDNFIGAEGRNLGALVSYRINELSLSTNVKHVGGRYDGAGYTLDNYIDWSAQVNYEINDNLSVSLRGFNLLNQKYDLWEGYQVRGTRGLFVMNYAF